MTIPKTIMRVRFVLEVSYFSISHGRLDLRIIRLLQLQLLCRNSPLLLQDPVRDNHVLLSSLFLALLFLTFVTF